MKLKVISGNYYGLNDIPENTQNKKKKAKMKEYSIIHYKLMTRKLVPGFGWNLIRSTVTIIFSLPRSHPGNISVDQKDWDQGDNYKPELIISPNVDSNNTPEIPKESFYNKYLMCEKRILKKRDYEKEITNY
jgi:hypothetical protein